MMTMTMTMTATTIVDDHNDGARTIMITMILFSLNEVLTATIRCKSTQIDARQMIGDYPEMSLEPR